MRGERLVDALGLRHRGDVGAEEPARAERLGRGLHHPPRLGQVQHHAVDLALLDPEVDVLGADRQGDDRPEPRLDVPLGAARELLARLVGNHAAGGADQPQQDERQRSRAHARLDHRLPGPMSAKSAIVARSFG